MGSEKPLVVVLSGAGISAESGLQTFRDKGGLWDIYPLHEVARPEAWQADPQRVLDFYNLRRRLVCDAQPNAAHTALVELEQYAQVQIITQNIDDLHERAGSSRVLHLHGEILWGRSSVYPACRQYIGDRDIEPGEQAADGSLLRPDVVWFGEPVPAITEAIDWVSQADFVLVVGTSLSVYPAASLIDFAPMEAMTVLIDPDAETHRGRVQQLRAGDAAVELPRWVDDFAGLRAG